MVKFQRRAQTATEYMIILAVVIIIALIVVGVMGGIPGLGSNTQNSVDSAVWSGGKIGVSNYGAKAGGGVKLRVKNNVGSPITIWYFNMSPNPAAAATHALYDDSNGMTLGVGEERDISDTTFNICNQAGDAWSSKIWVKYRNDATQYNYTYEGNGKLLSGICAG